jgi:stress response protein YsnF
VESAALTEGRLVLPVTRDAVRAAPELGEDGHLGPDDEARLRRHYGLGVAGTGEAAWTPSDTGVTPAGAGADDERTGRHAAADEAPVPAAAPAGPGPVADRADGAMVRSEEQLRVGTEQVAATRVRVVKYVVTEEVQITVPVRREEIRIEEVPLDAADEPGESLVAGPAGGGLPGEIVLHTERPVVSVEVVPTERVRLRTEVVEGQETVTGQVRREQIVADQQPVRARDAATYVPGPES